MRALGSILAVIGTLALCAALMVAAAALVGFGWSLGGSIAGAVIP